MGENNNTDYKGIIVLEGYMGSGKSSVGKKLSYRLKCEFNDTDSVIEKQAGKRISDIFATEGEEAFRKMETDLLRKYGEVKNKNKSKQCP